MNSEQLIDRIRQMKVNIVRRPSMYASSFEGLEAMWHTLSMIEDVIVTGDESDRRWKRAYALVARDNHCGSASLSARFEQFSKLLKNYNFEAFVKVLREIDILRNMQVQ